jgi:hypothetical protein
VVARVKEEEPVASRDWVVVKGSLKVCNAYYTMHWPLQDGMNQRSCCPCCRQVLGHNILVCLPTWQWAP